MKVTKNKTKVELAAINEQARAWIKVEKKRKYLCSLIRCEKIFYFLNSKVFFCFWIFFINLTVAINCYFLFENLNTLIRSLVLSPVVVYIIYYLFYNPSEAAKNKQEIQRLMQKLEDNNKLLTQLKQPQDE
jgi:cell division protein FtsL